MVVSRQLLMLIQSSSLFVLLFVDFRRSSPYFYVSRRSLATGIHAGIVICLICYALSSSYP